MQISATEEPSRPEFFLWDFVEAVVICYVEGNVCVFFTTLAVCRVLQSLCRELPEGQRRDSQPFYVSQNTLICLCVVSCKPYYSLFDVSYV